MLPFSEYDSICPQMPNHASETLACLSAPQPNDAAECATAADPFSKDTFSRRFSATFHLKKSNHSRHAQSAQLCSIWPFQHQVQIIMAAAAAAVVVVVMMMMMVVVVMMMMMMVVVMVMMMTTSTHLSFV
jgi:Flp pilus assembly protein TadB